VHAYQQPGHESSKHCCGQGRARAITKDSSVPQKELITSPLKGIHQALHSFEKLLLIYVHLCEVMNVLAVG